MKPKRTGAPAAEPVTLADAKVHLRVTHSEEDAYIQDLITVARETLEERIQRTLISTKWRLTLDCFGKTLVLPMAPVLTIDSFQYIDADGASKSLANTEYQLASWNDRDFLISAFGKAWPATQSNRYGTVQIEYFAGYGTTAESVPAPLRHWIKLAIGDMYANRERSSDRPVVPQNFADGLLDDFRDRAI